MSIVFKNKTAKAITLGVVAGFLVLGSVVAMGLMVKNNNNEEGVTSEETSEVNRVRSKTYLASDFAEGTLEGTLVENNVKSKDRNVEITATSGKGVTFYNLETPIKIEDEEVELDSYAVLKAVGTTDYNSIKFSVDSYSKVEIYMTDSINDGGIYLDVLKYNSETKKYEAAEDFSYEYDTDFGEVNKLTHYLTKGEYVIAPNNGEMNFYGINIIR